jgi:hypothetical protein
MWHQRPDAAFESDMRKLILLAAAAALSACGAAGDEAGEGAAEAKAVPGQAKQDSSAGAEWRRIDMDGGSALVFGHRRERPLAALRCDVQLESLLIERMTVTPKPGVDMMKVSAGGEKQRLPVMWDGASLPIAGATVRLEDRLADGLSRLGGTIEIELKGEPKLSMPPDRRIGTLIEECRQA